MNLKDLAEKIGLEEDEMLELVELFLETGKADYDQLKIAYDAGDAGQVARRAHTLSGAAGNLGLMPVHEAAKRIEQAALDDRMTAVSADVAALDDHFDRIARQIRG
ncbi:MAG TPA: Hpt domain-containing protein [Desulfosarcina sp.]|nr:Hpt domain-containing protein [Desulfosarcina sp.]